MKSLELLIPYASPSQRRTIATVVAEGSYKAAAEKLGRPAGALRVDISKARRKAARHEPAMHNTKAPPGYRLKGVSTLVGADGEVKQTWVKTTKELESPQALLEAFREAVADRPVRPRTIAPPPMYRDVDLLAAYPIGDAHIGMLAWGVETGADFDMKIAERNLVQATTSLVALAPPAAQAVLFNLGDFNHTDSTRNETTSGTRLDADSRWGKMLQVGLRTKIACIDLCLGKHDLVTVVVNPGNHDWHSATMLSLCLQQYYRNEPRVKMLVLPKSYTYVEFGENLLGTTHGNLCKLDQLPSIMASDEPLAWGRTKNRHWYVGHFHHVQVKEYRGCTTETVRTLASADHWHHSSGYRAGRSMQCDVWHRTRGRIVRHEIGIEEIEALASAK